MAAGDYMREECRRRAEMFLGTERYEIKSVHYFPRDNWKSGVNALPARCLIDFRDKEFSPDIDCDEYCWENTLQDAEDGEDKTALAECVETCQDNVKKALTSSVLFSLEDGIVFESTITGSCEKIWIDTGDTEADEEAEAAKEELFMDFIQAGCKVNEAWIHPHELAALGVELDLEYPAVCYFHAQARSYYSEKALQAAWALWNDIDDLQDKSAALLPMQSDHDKHPAMDKWIVFNKEKVWDVIKELPDDSHTNRLRRDWAMFQDEPSWLEFDTFKDALHQIWFYHRFSGNCRFGEVLKLIKG